MKILRISLLAAAALLAATPALADLKIGVAAEPYPPFTAKDVIRQMGGLGNRSRGCALRRDEGKMRDR